MKWLALTLIVLSPVAIYAQLMEMPAAGSPDDNRSARLVVVSGRIAAEGDSAPQSSATVVLECDDQVRGRAYTDTSGNFSLTVPVANTSGADPGATRIAQNGPLTQQDWSNCDVRADVPGFFSERRRLTQGPLDGNVNVGTIGVRAATARVDDPRFTVSVTSLAAPEKAKKAFDKGQEAERKGKWQAAYEYFKNAVSMYPRFAIAWLELGRVQARQNSLLDAQQSFQHAVSEDSRLVDGYVELARVAARQENWKSLASTTDTLVQRWPDTSPQYWFWNSVAYYNLGDLGKAENSVTHGLRLDTRHEIPQMEYLYGIVLGTRKDYKGAADHISVFLQLVPNSAEAPAARQALDAYQQRAKLEAAEQQ
jgi:tetratricopeptide (TPR) repeat protein